MQPGERLVAACVWEVVAIATRAGPNYRTCASTTMDGMLVGILTLVDVAQREEVAVLVHVDADPQRHKSYK